MSKAAKLEYIWLDGFEPTQSLRSKTLIRNKFSGKLKDCPDWSFDGSSTRQAEGNDSDCLLKPVAIYPDPDRKNGYLVMNEVYNADGTPHVTNARATIDDDDSDFWFGFEQEYFLWDPETDLPLGFPRDQTPQGQFYCSVGAKNTFGREIIEDHLDQCLDAGLNVEGINAEVIYTSTIKPFDYDTINTSIVKTGKYLVIEEHSRFGGVGDEVMHAVQQIGKIKSAFLSIPDRFIHGYGDYSSHCKTLKLTAIDIIHETKNLCR